MANISQNYASFTLGNTDTTILSANTAREATVLSSVGRASWVKFDEGPTNTRTGMYIPADQSVICYARQIGYFGSIKAVNAVVGEAPVIHVVEFYGG